MPSRLVAACLSLAAALIAPAAHASPATPPSAVAPLAPAPPATVAHPLHERKDPGVALGLSLGVTAGGMALIAIGGQMQSGPGGGLATVGALATIIGPSTGHAYAGRIGNAGLGIRAASTAAGTLALFGVIGCALGGHDDIEGDYHDDDDDGACGLWLGALAASAIGYVGGTIYEIADAPRAARRHNARHGLDVQVAPVMVGGDGNRAPGLAIAGRF